VNYHFGGVPFVVVIVEIVGVVNDGGIPAIPISMMVVVMVVSVNSDGNDWKREEIGWIKTPVIRWVIGDINR
jgi:hypothetical protein